MHPSPRAPLNYSPIGSLLHSMVLPIGTFQFSKKNIFSVVTLNYWEWSGNGRESEMRVEDECILAPALHGHRPLTSDQHLGTSARISTTDLLLFLGPTWSRLGVPVEVANWLAAMDVDEVLMVISTSTPGPLHSPSNFGRRMDVL